MDALEKIDQDIADTRQELERRRVALDALVTAGHIAQAVRSERVLQAIEDSLLALQDRRRQLLDDFRQPLATSRKR